MSENVQYKVTEVVWTPNNCFYYIKNKIILRKYSLTKSVKMVWGKFNVELASGGQLHRVVMRNT